MPEPSDQLQAIIDRLDRGNEMLSILAERIAPPVYRAPGRQAIVNASGFATIVFDNFPGGVDKIWFVDKIFVYTNTAVVNFNVGVFVMEGLPQGATRDNPNALTTAIDALYQKDATTFATAGGDEITPIYVKGGENLIFQWSGLNQNDRCVASMQYKLAWQGQG